MAQPAVTFTISAPKTAFYLGETVPLQLSFSTSVPNTYTADSRLYDRIGRMNYVEVFQVEPADGVEDPLHGVQGEDGGMGGLSGGPRPLSETPFTFQRDLNEWVRFKRPGTYRVTVVSHRVSGLELRSNPVTFEIQPAPAEWIQAQIAAAVRALDAPDSKGEARSSAARVLRFLNTPESATAALMRLDDNTYDLHLAVLTSSYRSQLLPLMEKQLVAPNQPIGYRYLYTLSQLAGLLAASPNWNETNDRYAAQLAAALPAKRLDARAISLVTLLIFAGNTGPQRPWLHGVLELLVRDFPALPSATQSQILDSQWRVLNRSTILPLLKELAKASDPDPVVVRRLSELAPEDGRRVLLAQLRRPESRLPFDLLASLPDRTLPELDETLAARMEAGQRDDRLIVRYASGAILQRVERAYQQRRPECATPLAYYFLKYDPEYGERELRRSLAMPNSFPACYDIGYTFPGPWAMSPALERLATEMLSSPSVPIKNGAATVLGKYGSAAAQEPLWRTLEFFHTWWKDREADLKGDAGREGIQFERTLRSALAQANAWTLGEAGLTRLQSLCSSDWCRQDVAGWLQSAKSPVRIDVMPMGGDLHFQVAQYDIRTEDELRRRLALYPHGTSFQLQSLAGATAREQVRSLVVAAGHLVD
jgi:hypothetical protein